MAFGSCCCGTGVPSGSCAEFALATLTADCPATVTISGDFNFEFYTAGGSSRGCLGMPTTRPLWGKVRRGKIPVISKLHRVICNGNTPYITEYKIQETCMGGCGDNDSTNYPLLCPDNCTAPAYGSAGCRTYIARENPCTNPNHSDQIGTEISCNKLMGLDITSQRRMPCTGVIFHTCSHFGGSDGYKHTPATSQFYSSSQNQPTPSKEDAHELLAPGLPSVIVPTGGTFDTTTCPTCFSIRKPIFGPFSNGFPACTGTAVCTSKVVSCEECSFDINEVCVLPHLRAAVTGVTCYTVKDSYNNCVEAWIHIALPELFSGPWRSGDPFVPIGINNVFPGGSPGYPKLLTAAFANGDHASVWENSEGFIRPSGADTYQYPFTWGRQITTTPKCIPAGQYVMFGNMGSGLIPTVFNRCQATCVGTNSSNQTLNYSSITEDFTQPFTGCLAYFDRNAPFDTCFEMYFATGYVEGPGDGTLPLIGVTCSDPQCCCRPWRTAEYQKDAEIEACIENIFGTSGPADPTICHTFNAKPFPKYTNVDQLTRYYAHNHPRNNCTKGIGAGFIVRDRNHPLWTCTGYSCCGSAMDCAVQDEGLLLQCGGIDFEAPDTRVYNCTNPQGGANLELRCPTGTCMYNIKPHGLTTHAYVHLLREFPADLDLKWGDIQ